jgi:hypothetical protein
MNRIRKTLAIVMVIIMAAFLFTSCGANKSKSGKNISNKDIVGSWKCSALDMGTGNILDQLGSSYADTILFYALDDGTCLLDMAGQQLKMEWEWMDDNDDYRLSISLASFAEANGMTEEEMMDQLQGSNSADVDTEQEYRAVMKDGSIIVDMAKFYDEKKDSEESSAAPSAKMEFTFDRSGDAPESLDKVMKKSTETADATENTANPAEEAEAPAEGETATAENE